MRLYRKSVILVSLFLAVGLTVGQGLFASKTAHLHGLVTDGQGETIQSIHSPLFIPGSLVKSVATGFTQYSGDPTSSDLQKENAKAMKALDAAHRLAFFTEKRVFYEALILEKLVARLYPKHFFL
ncbi:hypothetical protein [Roseivirga sp. UBA1976]|uniref:hypothetical protein n=1 Tax=Roseivirga sp. UBA1976 TaxID=1947386 RepID=UPI00257BC78B|nr:hypothetical protein [Roseivirga sp. UBA1976]